MEHIKSNKPAGKLLFPALLLSSMAFNGFAKTVKGQDELVLNCASENVQKEVLDALHKKLVSEYIFPKKANAFKKHMQSPKAQKALNEVKNCDALVNTVNQWLAEITADKHLHVTFSPFEIPEDTPESKAQFSKQKDAFMRSLNYGFEQVQRLPFNIGYVNLILFSDIEKGGPQLASTMNLLRYTDALIIDLRESRGGEPAMVDLIASYLLNERTNTSNIYYRNENRTEERFTTVNVTGNHYGQQRPLYILTSKDTFSAAEDLAYTLKHLNRATIIGEVTGGGAHPGEVIKLTNHFEGFIPNGRSINPVTKTNWEGVGVQPHIKTSADNALNTAQREILITLKNSEVNLTRANRMQKRIDRLKL
ncbi:hypothetical protein CWB72_02125 [Pseudoalteromonas phenolica]|uniref:S41 family peptidase n=1 Tax=Pseudoalteromonas phenolica TaxID=161398 RepID=UPI00110BAB14|nr:S41 family peptidase [Pseudoalteromonas phenolica]TMN93451.1 hypothetical protein CWB72_02125 [Pseudoalteromonas phenolica]